MLRHLWPCSDLGHGACGDAKGGGNGKGRKSKKSKKSKKKSKKAKAVDFGLTFKVSVSLCVFAMPPLDCFWAVITQAEAGDAKRRLLFVCRLTICLKRRCAVQWYRRI